MRSASDIIRQKEIDRLAYEESLIPCTLGPREPRRAPVERPLIVELQGIISRAEGGYKAIVNDEVVGRGDRIQNGVEILKIDSNGVTFRKGKKVFTKTVGDQ